MSHKPKLEIFLVGTVEHTFNSRSWTAEAGGLWNLGQDRLHSKAHLNTHHHHIKISLWHKNTYSTLNRLWVCVRTPWKLSYFLRAILHLRKYKSKLYVLELICQSNILMTSWENKPHVHKMKIISLQLNTASIWYLLITHFSAQEEHASWN